MRKGWETANLGEVCEMINRGISPKYIEEGGICVINQKCIRNHTINTTLARRHDVTAKSINPERYIQLGDVLVNSTGTGTLGRVAQVRREPNELTTVDTHVTIVRPHPGKFFNDFFGYMLVRIEDEIASSGEGASGQTELARITIAEKFNVSFPISISEQKQIVAILDEAFEAIDRALANTEKNLANSREVFESYLNAIFTQKGDGWTEKTLIDVCVFQGGSQPPKSVFSVEKKEGYVRLIQIRDYKSDKYIIHIPKKDARRFCQPDDIMIGRYGPPLFQILRGLEGAYNVALMKAIPNEEIISKDFLFYFLKNNRILNYVINSSSRTAGQTGINKATIEPYPIAFPTLENQAIIVSQLQELKIETQRLEAIYRQKITALKELKQSILQKAFTGELTADTPKTVKEKIAA